MYLAIVDNSTMRVVNIVVPPKAPNVWRAPEGHTAVETTTAHYGDIWDGNAFTKPEPE